MGRNLSTVLCACLLASLSPGCNAPDGSARPGGSRRAPGASWLKDAGGRLGLDFAYQTGATGEFRLPEIMGAGVALFDHDGDGDLDLYFTNGGSGANRLFSRQPDGTYEDATARSGLGDEGYGMGVAIGDFDNDGDPDVFLTNHGPDRLLVNRGDGQFADATEEAGIRIDGWSSSAAFLDYDRDGWLDLWVVRYVKYDPGKSCSDAAGRPDYCAPSAFAALPDVLLHNEGDGSFRDVSRRAGIRAAVGAGLGLVADDFDGDGLPDVFVANDGHANHLWLNRGDGTFRDGAVLFGVAYNADGRAEASMGVIAEDLDGELGPDLFLTHLAGETNTFYRSRGAATGFDDATGPGDLATPSVVFTGFGTAAVDLELDGDLDIVLANGRVTRAPPRADARVGAPWDLFAEPNLAFLGDGRGRFVVTDAELAEFTDPVEVSRGLAVGDVDADGDIDVVVSNIGSTARLYLNEAPRRGGWLAVRAIDPRYRRDALGARVTLSADGARMTRTIRRASSYLSSSAPRAHFGLGELQGTLQLQIDWPDGLRELYDVKQTDLEITVHRGEGRQP